MSRNETQTIGTPMEQRTYDWTEFGSPSIAIIEGVATILDKEPTEIPQLYQYVDPDSLERLLLKDGEPVKITFQYAGLSVEIESTGDLELGKCPVSEE